MAYCKLYANFAANFINLNFKNMKTIKELKHGAYFTLKEIEEPTGKQIWIRDDYDASEKAYLCYNWENTSKWKYLKGNKKVYDNEHFIF